MGEHFRLLISATVQTLVAGARQRRKRAVLEKKFAELNFPAHCVEGFVDAIKTHQIKLEDPGDEITHVTHKKIAGMKWRVDVTISSNLLQRVMKPSILMQITLNNGDIRTFEMTQVYERKPILQLIADLEKG